MCSGVFIFFLSLRIPLLHHNFLFESCSLFFCDNLIFWVHSMLFRRDLFSAYFPFYLSILSYFCGYRFVAVPLVVCVIIVRSIFVFFLSFLASYFFDLACSRRYMYDPSNYHSSFLLILIIHLPFLWEMRCTHHDSTKSRNYDNIRRDIKSGFNSHSFLHRYTLLRYRASVHTNHLFFTL